jgi:hypothetical protein
MYNPDASITMLGTAMSAPANAGFNLGKKVNINYRNI